MSKQLALAADGDHLSTDTGAEMLQCLSEQRGHVAMADEVEHYHVETVLERGGVKGQMHGLA